MLSMISLLVAGFLCGVVLTSFLALYVYGLLRAETARILDDHCFAFSGVPFRTYPPQSSTLPGSSHYDQ